MRFRLFGLLVIMSVLLVACGSASQEKVVKKLGEQWGEGKGYELTATMEMKTGSGEPRTYDVNVWHTKPDFYRVTVTEKNDNVTQMIVRNEEGVFVVTPALRKTYKFQSEWPKQNSQAYLIGGLAQDLVEDKKAVMTEKDGEYIFEAATRNADKTGLPSQKVVVDKETMLPKSVAIMDENQEEKILIEFEKVDLNVAHKKEEYAVEKFSENEENEVAAADIEDKEFKTHYPTVQWENTKLVDEKAFQEDGVERVILTFEGDKAYTLMQQPAASGNSVLPVFAPGDLADLGFTIGAITDNSISWEKDGVSFFIASTKLTREEMMEVASSMSAGNMK